MFWLRGEDGAISIIVALLMVVLLGFTAVAIDGAGLYAKQEQLQNGADAAALAIAQDCAEQSCRESLRTAQDLVAANLGGGLAAVDAPTFSDRPSQVTVSVSTTRDNLFAGVLGIDQSTVSAQASAVWANPAAGTSVLPLAVSWCDFAAQTGGGPPSTPMLSTIAVAKEAKASCTAPSGSAAPSGFSWLATDPGSCHATSTATGHAATDPARATQSICTRDSFASLQDTTVPVPVYDLVGGAAKAAWVHVYGYAAFHLTGYNIAGTYRWNAPCAGTNTCIRGYFTRSTDLSGTLESGAGAPDLGLSLITLTR